MMPGESGLDLCRELGADPTTRDLPVLFLSARAATEDKITGLTLGAVDYLAKPFDPAELVARCRAALRTRERAREAASRELESFKGEVLGLVSHEFRTPLSIVLGYAELLRARGDHLNSQQRDLFVREIASGSTRLARLVEDVLLLTSPPPPLQAMDLREPVDMAVDATTADFQRRRVTLELNQPDDPLFVQGSPLSLTAAIRHLLENAVNFSPPGGRVVVTLTREPVFPAGRFQVRLTVADEGPGIPPAEQSRIFERFYQVSRGTRREHGGLGLGLALVQQVATQHGGSVQVDSTVGEGSRFSLELPAAPYRPTDVLPRPS
jgi:signal transduction histidine kinase